MICMVQYACVVSAHAAVEDFPKQRGPEWECLDSVFWAANKEPDFIAANERTAAEVGNRNCASASSTPMRKTGHGDADSPSSFLDQGGSTTVAPPGLYLRPGRKLARASLALLASSYPSLRSHLLRHSTLFPLAVRMDSVASSIVRAWKI